MDFELNDEQRMYQRAVRNFCEGELKPYAAEVDETGELRSEAMSILIRSSTAERSALRLSFRDITSIIRIMRHI